MIQNGDILRLASKIGSELSRDSADLNRKTTNLSLLRKQFIMHNVDKGFLLIYMLTLISFLPALMSFSAFSTYILFMSFFFNGMMYWTVLQEEH